MTVPTLNLLNNQKSRPRHVGRRKKREEEALLKIEISERQYLRAFWKLLATYVRLLCRTPVLRHFYRERNINFLSVPLLPATCYRSTKQNNRNRRAFSEPIRCICDASTFSSQSVHSTFLLLLTCSRWHALSMHGNADERVIDCWGSSSLVQRVVSCSHVELWPSLSRAP